MSKSIKEIADQRGLNLQTMTDEQFETVIDEMEPPSGSVIWTGKVPFEDPTLCSQAVPQGTPLKNEIIRLMQQFIPHFKLNPDSNSSYTMLLPAKKKQEPLILQIIRKNANSYSVIIQQNPPQATIQRLTDLGRVFN